MAQALCNLQTFLAVYLHPAFDRTLDPICLTLTGGVFRDHVRHCDDLYIWMQIQEALARWSRDVRERPWSVEYPRISLAHPTGVAQLLSSYAIDLSQSADLSRLYPGRKWTFQPHDTFYSAEGQLALYRGRGLLLGPVDYKKYGAEISIESHQEEEEAAEARFRKVSSLICVNHLRKLLGLRGGRTCPQCPRRHLSSLQEVTLAEVVAITEDWSRSEKRRRDDCTEFRAST